MLIATRGFRTSQNFNGFRARSWKFFNLKKIEDSLKFCSKCNNKEYINEEKIFTFSCDEKVIVFEKYPYIPNGTALLHILSAIGLLYFWKWF